ncbi:MAG: hypothetical protein WD336_07050, partial [Trueperaceae bacterium]
MSGVRLLRVALVCLVLAGLAVAAAQTVTIDTHDDPNARLELRTIRLPSGEERTLYLIEAERVTVRSDGVTLIASRLEFDPELGQVRIIGRGRVERPDETLVGDDLIVSLRDGRLDGTQVLVITGSVEVRGERAQRVEGRIRLMEGSFGPCARCGQEVEDFGFRAERIEILPGDRLIAWEAQILIRERPVMNLPLLVLPIAEPSRVPRLEIRSGSETTPSEVRLDWPYASGANAYGTFTARWLADVDPERGGFFDGALLGGRPVRSYLALGVDHRFYDDRGAGRIEASYRPPLEEHLARDASEARVRLEAAYRTDAAADGPAVRFRVGRDDAVRRDLLEVDAEVATELATPWGDARVAVSTRLPVPLTAEAVRSPSWDGANTARAEPLRLRFEAHDALPRNVGPVRIEDARLDLGAFRDAPDPTHRGVAGLSQVSDGRFEVEHRVALPRATVAGFLEVSGSNHFRGRYYGGGERQVAWRSELRSVARFGRVGSFELRFQRDANEGETPFAFDRIALRNRSDLRATLDLRPLTGVQLRAEAGYVLEDDRRPDELGLSPTRLRLDAFTNLPALSLSLTHDADPAEGDPGTLSGEVGVRLDSGRFTSRADLSGLWDIDPSQPGTDEGEAEGEPERDRTRADGSVEAGARDVATLRLEAGIEAEPSDPDRGDWTPLRATLTLGTLSEREPWPGVELRAEWDLNEGELLTAGYRAAADLGPVRLEAEERYGPEDGPPGTHRFTARWRTVLRATLEGVTLVPAAWWGLEPDPDATRRVTVRVEDDGGQGGSRGGGQAGVRFRAELRTTFVPTDDGTERRGTLFEARVRLADRAFAAGRIRVALDGFVDVPLPDDALPGAWLRRANLELGLDLFGTVGLQGTFGYRGSYDVAEEEVRSGRLTLDEVALVVRPTRDLAVGAVLNDVWELVDEDVGEFAFDPRPRLFLTWDRCCWALYGSWDTRSGELVITIGAPGTPEGPQFTLDDGPTIPFGNDDDRDPGAFRPPVRPGGPDGG